MKYIRFLSICCSVSLLLCGGCSAAAQSTPPSLAKGLNIGNALEAPKDQPWDVPMDLSYFSLIRQAGFKTVRLPVRFSDYTSDDGSYRLDEAFLSQIDNYIEEALAQKLTIILDFHHFTDMMENPGGNRNKFIAIWQQLADRYQDFPETLLFELLNEPQQNLNAHLWNDILAETVSAIREIDQTHYLIIGGVNFNSIDALAELQLPEDDKIIATVHYYEPNEVTFQGNSYHQGYEHLHDIPWSGNEEELAYLQSRLKTAKEWADRQQVPLFLGEFGIARTAPASTRTAWTAAVAAEAEALGLGTAYWEFASGFGLYDLTEHQWDKEMLAALLPEGAG